MKRVPGAALEGVLLTLVVGILSGCTTVSAGKPRPENTPTISAETAGTSEQGTPPTRPSDLSLGDVDPCSLIAEGDYSQFHLTDPGQPRQEDDGSPQCLWTGTDAGYLGLTLDSESIEVWLDGSRAGKGEETDPVLGFPAVEIADPGDRVTCFVAVGVSDNEQLLIQVGLNESPPADVPPACDYAHQFATSAMSTLVES